MGTDDEPCRRCEINEVVHRYSDRASHASDVRNSAKMSPVGWEALGQWGEDAARIEPLAGGVVERTRPRAPRGRSSRCQERC